MLAICLGPFVSKSLAEPSTGSRQSADYADAANAFFDLIPGQPVQVKLRRGAGQLEFTLMPTEPAPH